MKKFHRNLNIMSVFTAVLLVGALLFWQTIFNIAISNVLLNGIIIGTTVFGIGLCFVNIFELLPEYTWLHAYFEGKTATGIAPKLLRPVSLAVHNKHTQITTSTLTELLDLVSIKIEDKRDSVRYITNTLIFLGLLGTFWGLIITVGGFAELLLNIDFEDPDVLVKMQHGMAGPLSGMATAFTSSLLGLAGSLIVGFLGLQLQFAQNTIFQDLSDFMTKYVLKIKDADEESDKKLVKSAPVNEQIYNKISEIYDAFTDAGYVVQDLIRINKKYPVVIATGTNERLFIGTYNMEYEDLKNVQKRLELCFSDTLEAININTKFLCVSDKNIIESDGIIRFASTNSLHKYLEKNPNTKPKTKEEWDDFDAYCEYINAVLDYLFN
ncbi:MAG: hypothetical protein IKN73_01520 [Alphaproteobacteria bacterium]|nr:hypothetical protein [Alphaproteobacteria bacterium]